MNYKKILFSVLLMIFLSFSVSAETYSDILPDYVPIAGGAFAECLSDDLGTFTVLIPYDQNNAFGLLSDSYELVNTSSDQIDCMVYAGKPFNYETSPTSLVARFQKMSTLEISAPELKDGKIVYQWKPVRMKSIKATTLNIQDTSVSGRQNDAYRYSTAEKIGICILCCVLALVLLKIFKKGWRS